MPEYTIILIPGGYQILRNGVLWIDQPGDPEKPFIDGEFQPFESQAAAQAHADAFVADQKIADASNPEYNPDPVEETPGEGN